MIKIVEKKEVAEVNGGVTCVNQNGDREVFPMREFCPEGWSKASGGAGGGSSSK
ncbi:hypothetical protein ACPV4H_17905 [Vibrio rotiferianus]|uniref:hypothetical protein n=1 Tax=Vibrio rotiferianus TaxID=190895 RepID=UPI00406A8FCF